MTAAPPSRPAIIASRALCTLLVCAAIGPTAALAQATGSWEVAGRQGLIQVVIVPPAQLRDREAYARQIALLCQPQATCFINFFGNSTGAPVSVPLPDAISNEPAAIFRRSTKQGAELLRWSCRLGKDDGCF